MKEKVEAMKELYDDLIANRSLPLYKYRTNNKYLPVVGEGSLSAKIMFIGEAPGKKEAKTGKPFCGASGKFLDELLAHVGIKRKSVYVTNIVKDRPQENRDPTLKEIKSYGPYLDRQIEILKPTIITTLGRFSMNYIMEKFALTTDLAPISSIHGKVFIAQVSYGKIKIIPHYHPASALYNSSLRHILKKDFEILKQLK